MKFWDEKEVQSAYHMKDAIHDIEALFEDIDQVIQTQRLVIPTGEGAQAMLYMPSIHKRKALGIIKITSITPNNPEHHRPTTQANIILTDISTGQHLASLDGSYLTRLRTGALSGIASKFMSRTDSKTLGMIGTGGMAYEQLLGNLEVRPIEKVYLFNRTEAKAIQFKNRILKDFPDLEVEVVQQVKTLVQHSDIINCQTQSTTPVFQAEDVKPGTHINGIGSYRPEMKELDYHLFPKAQHIVFDDIEGVTEEAGEFIEAHEKHIFHFNEVSGDLKSVVLNKDVLRESNHDITVFKCVGAAYFDLAVAIGAYQKLKSQS